MTRWKHGNRREGGTCEGATSNVPNVSSLELCGSSDHAEVAEAPPGCVKQVTRLNWVRGKATSHICHPTHTPSHVPESSPRGPGSAPPYQKGSRSGTPRNIRPSASEIRRRGRRIPKRRRTARRLKGNRTGGKKKRKRKKRRK